MVFQIVAYLFTIVSHYQAHICDPGYLLPHHFREDDKLYIVEGSQDIQVKNHGQPTAQQEAIKDMEVSEHKECSLTQCIKVRCQKSKIYVEYDGQANRCVLGLAQYSSLIGNIVAYGSYKFFFLFIFYSFL